MLIRILILSVADAGSQNDVNYQYYFWYIFLCGCALIKKQVHDVKSQFQKRII